METTYMVTKKGELMFFPPEKYLQLWEIKMVKLYNFITTLWNISLSFGTVVNLLYLPM